MRIMRMCEEVCNSCDNLFDDSSIGHDSWATQKKCKFNLDISMATKDCPRFMPLAINHEKELIKVIKNTLESCDKVSNVHLIWNDTVLQFSYKGGEYRASFDCRKLSTEK